MRQYPWQEMCAVLRFRLIYLIQYIYILVLAVLYDGIKVHIKYVRILHCNDNDNDNDNDNILCDHNVQIEITIFNSLENQIISWSGDYY